MSLPEKLAELLEACEAGDLAAVKSAVQAGADVNGYIDYGNPLMHAVEFPEVVAFLLDSGAEAGGTVELGTTALHWAANGGELEAMTLLIDNGADVNAQRTDGETPLHAACSDIQDEAAELLLKRGATVDATDQDGWTPLMIAAHWDDRAVALTQQLLEAGADPNSYSKDGWTPLLLATEPEIVWALAAAGADVDQRHAQFRFTALMARAILSDARPQVIEVLLQAGANPTLAQEEPQVSFKPQGVLAANLFSGLQSKASKRVGKTVLEMVRDKASRAMITAALA